MCVFVRVKEIDRERCVCEREIVSERESVCKVCVFVCVKERDVCVCESVRERAFVKCVNVRVREHL